jgi:hypothetical protein
MQSRQAAARLNSYITGISAMGAALQELIMPMSRLLFALALPFLMAGCAGLDGAPSYPRVIANGENTVIEYGSGQKGNVIGGGPVALSGGASENITITYFDRSKVQMPPAGRVPVVTQQGENMEIVWVPMPSSALAAR